MRPRTALILAAGRGQRLGPLGRERPKGFIELDGQPIIERSIALLAAAGVSRTIIVTGHQSGFYGELAARVQGIELVHNPRHAESGSLYSLCCAAQCVTEDLLLLESDLVYERRALEALLGADEGSTLLVSGPTRSGDEVYVEAAGGVLTGLSKRRDELKGTVIGELVGITRLSRACLEAVTAYAAEAFRSTLAVEYEQALVAASRVQPIRCLVVEDLAWSEIDDEAHLERARAAVLPLIRLRDRQASSRGSPC